MQRQKTDAETNAAGNAPANDDQMRCPRCDSYLVVLYWMARVPDGYVCNSCRVLFDDGLNVRARVF